MEEHCVYIAAFLLPPNVKKHDKAHFPSRIPGVGLPLSPMMSSLKR